MVRAQSARISAHLRRKVFLMDLFGLCCATDDKNEGTTAFLEKRAANFQGK